MDATIVVLITSLLQTSTSLYLAYLRQQGKTEEEIAILLADELKKAMAFDPNTIKDV